MKNIHILPTDKPSRLIYNDANQLCYHSNKSYKNDRKWMHRKKFNIYITSDEEIKEGDYWLYICPINGMDFGDNGNPIVKSNLPKYWFEKLHDRKNYYKIILTTDRDLIYDGIQAIDDEFLEWFVKNQACENVYVHKEYKQINQDNPITVGSTTLVFSHYETVIPKEEPKDVLLGYKTSLVAQMLDSKEISEEPIEETLEDAAEKFVNNTRLQNRKVLFMEGAKWQQEQILNFLYEEITERRPYSASKMCEKVIEFIKKNDR